MEQLVERAYATFHEEARRRGIDYRSDLTAQPVLMTDGDRVLQIITNLLSNAFRWTPDGGRIELGLTPENGAVAVTVADTGPGIAAGRAGADLPAVLVARRRRHRARPRDRARAGAGARRPDRARHRVGRGSTFELVLPSEPAVTSRRQPARGRRAPAAPRAPSGRRSSRCARGSGRRTCCSSRGSSSRRSSETRARWAEAVAIFVAYCAASSAAYLVNDLRDAPDDRAHPVKRDAADRARRAARGARARARGRARRRRARDRRGARLRVAAASSLGFLALQLAYSLGLKRVVLVDVAVDRGAVRRSARPRARRRSTFASRRGCSSARRCSRSSSALAKRRGELVLVRARRTPGRPVLDGYSLRLVDQLLNVVAVGDGRRVRGLRVDGALGVDDG